jgi:hypothetical protein
MQHELYKESAKKDFVSQTRILIRALFAGIIPGGNSGNNSNPQEGDLPRHA